MAYRSIDDTARSVIAATVVLSDERGEFWSDDEGVWAATYLDNIMGGKPDLKALSDIWGAAAVQTCISQFIAAYAARPSERELPFLGGYCHICGCESPASFPFGLATPSKVSRDWLPVAASVALAALTIPLLGGARLSGPGKTERFRMAVLHLVLCDGCLLSWPTDSKGRHVLNRDAYSHHPSWSRLVAQGSTRFLTAAQIGEYSRQE